MGIILLDTFKHVLFPAVRPCHTYVYVLSSLDSLATQDQQFAPAVKRFDVYHYNGIPRPRSNKACDICQSKYVDSSDFRWRMFTEAR